MVHVHSVAALCSAFVGLGRAAALGSAEEYADGSVHARIMALKTVWHLAYLIPIVANEVYV